MGELLAGDEVVLGVGTYRSEYLPVKRISFVGGNVGRDGEDMGVFLSGMDRTGYSLY